MSMLQGKFALKCVVCIYYSLHTNRLPFVFFCFRNPYGPTMEWGFLYSIMSNPEVAGLIDELYIELHFTFPFIGWRYEHSNWEALDTFRYLREHGVVVHAWP